MPANTGQRECEIWRDEKFPLYMCLPDHCWAKDNERADMASVTMDVSNVYVRILAELQKI